MIAYHEVSPDSLGSILEAGLKCTSRGAKGDDTAIIKTDAFLDEHCPQRLKSAGVSRDNNVYAYVSTGRAVVDITEGEPVPLKVFIANSTQAVLEVEVDANRCFVSDLDTYDALKAAIEAKENKDTLQTLAKSYWDKLTPLSEFKEGGLRRPEIMITYDVPAHQLRVKK